MKLDVEGNGLTKEEMLGTEIENMGTFKFSVLQPGGGHGGGVGYFFHTTGGGSSERKLGCTSLDIKFVHSLGRERMEKAKINGLQRVNSGESL